MTDWTKWHEEYADPNSRLSLRRREVQTQLAAALDRAPAGPLRLISACAGEGLDVIPVLATHARGSDVTARLVELEPGLADRARAHAPSNVEVVTGDASNTDAYAGAVPANIALFCGIFGNIRNDDIRKTIRVLPSLLAADGEVLWTRHTMDPDLTPTIRGWFAEAGFEEPAFIASETRYAVGTHRLAATTTPAPFEAGVTMFEFVGR